MNINKWWDKHGTGVIGGVDFLGQAINTMLYNGPSGNELLSDAGMSNRTVNGVGYQVYNNINKDEVMNLEHKTNISNTIGLMGKGATVGSAFGPLGAAAGAAIGGIAGLFAGGHAHRETNRALEDAYNRAWHTNTYNRSVAATEGMLGDLANEYGNTRNLLIFAKDGIEANNKRLTGGMNRLVESTNGFEVAEHNAQVLKGEPTYNKETRRGHIVLSGVSGKDATPFHVDENTTIYTYNLPTGHMAAPLVAMNEYINNKIDSIKGDSAKQVAEKVASKTLGEIDSKLRDIEDLLREMKYGQYNAPRRGMLYADDGTESRIFPGMDERWKEELVGVNPFLPSLWGTRHIPLSRYVELGNLIRSAKFVPTDNDSEFEPNTYSSKLGWGNTLAGAAGMGIGIAQYLDANNQRIKTPNTYVPNTQASRAYKTLSEIKVNPLPLLRGADVDAATMRHKLLSSGATAALKYIGGIATDALSQANKANLAAGIQQMNNQYRAAEANARLEYGMKDAVNRMQSKQWDLDYTSKAHAARLAGKQLGIQNTLKALEQYIANANKLGMFRDMRDLYDMDIKSRSK